jgi:hypothetical protein
MLPLGCKNFLYPGSMLMRICAMVGAMAINISLSMLSLGIAAFRYALPMSRDITVAEVPLEFGTRAGIASLNWGMWTRK